MIQPTLGDVRSYVDDLWNATSRPELPDTRHLNRMKKFLNFVGQGVDPEGQFLHEMRRAREVDKFFSICDAHMTDQEKASQPFAGEPYQGVLARPNHEGDIKEQGCRL